MNKFIKLDDKQRVIESLIVTKDRITHQKNAPCDRVDEGAHSEVFFEEINLPGPWLPSAGCAANGDSLYSDVKVEFEILSQQPNAARRVGTMKMSDPLQTWVVMFLNARNQPSYVPLGMVKIYNTIK